MVQGRRHETDPDSDMSRASGYEEPEFRTLELYGSVCALCREYIVIYIYMYINTYMQSTDVVLAVHSALLIRGVLAFFLGITLSF